MIVKVARDVLADGPASIGTILSAAGRTRTPHGVRVTEAALEQLGALAVGKVRGGGTAYALQAHSGDEPEQATATKNATPEDGLREAIAELARTAVGLERRRVPVPVAQAARHRSLAGRRPAGPPGAQRSRWLMGGPSPILDRSGTSRSNDHGEFEVDNIREAEGHKPAPEETRTYRVGVTLEITADSESDAIALVRHEVRGLADTRRSSSGMAHAWVDARATDWCNAGECPSSVCLLCRESGAMSEVNCV